MIFAVLLILAFLLLLAFAVYQFIAVPIMAPHVYDVRKIKHGDTKEAVRELFGSPSQIVLGGMSAEEWIYTLPMEVFATISFDCEGRVTDTYRTGPLK